VFSAKVNGRSAWEEFELIAGAKDRGVSFTSTLPTLRRPATKSPDRPPVTLDSKW
jgi:hypothetical protein